MESSSSHSETFLTNSSSGREEIYSVGCTKVYKFTKDGHTYAQKCIIKKSSNKKRIKR